MNQSNSGYMEAQNELKQTRVEADTFQKPSYGWFWGLHKKRDAFLTILLDKSSELKNKIVSILKTSQISESIIKQTL